VYDQIEPSLLELVEDCMFCRKPDATERLLARAQEEREKLEAAKAAGGGAAPGARAAQEWRDKSVQERLTYSLASYLTVFEPTTSDFFFLFRSKAFRITLRPMLKS
jgi:5-methyltetrahydrofolate--homocysteine methyltransferase